MTVIKVGPPFHPSGTSWNHIGKKDIAQIFISSSQSRIICMRFAYVENEGDNIVRSKKIGCDGISCTSMETVTLDYPSEYITRVSGECANGNGGKHLIGVTFYSNKGTYGPYGPSKPDVSGPVIEFNYQVGGRFFGFFGTYNPGGIESIGFYMKPIKRKASQLQEQQDNFLESLHAKRSEFINKRILKIYDYAGRFRL